MRRRGSLLSRMTDDLRYGGGGAGGSGGPTTLLSDTFTDDDATAIAAHTMDVGPGWTVGAGTWTITSNKLTPSGTNGHVSVDGGVTSYTLQTTLRIGTTPPSLAYPGLLFRYASLASCFLLRVDAFTENQLNLYEDAATVRGTAAFTAVANTDYVLKVVVTPTLIECYIDDVLKISYASVYNAAETKVGIYAYDGPDAKFDNFSLVA